MKKVLVLLLSLMILALGVSGCGNGQQSDAEQPGKTETTKLRLLHNSKNHVL